MTEKWTGQIAPDRLPVEPPLPQPMSGAAYWRKEANRIRGEATTATYRADLARRNYEALTADAARALATIIVLVAALAASAGYVAAMLILSCPR